MTLPDALIKEHCAVQYRVREWNVSTTFLSQPDVYKIEPSFSATSSDVGAYFQTNKNEKMIAEAAEVSDVSNYTFDINLRYRAQ